MAERWKQEAVLSDANGAASDVRGYLARAYPGVRDRMYTPRAAEVHLSALGSAAWQLVCLESVRQGDNAAIDLGTESMKWTHAHLATTKRRIG